MLFTSYNRRVKTYELINQLNDLMDRKYLSGQYTLQDNTGRTKAFLIADLINFKYSIKNLNRQSFWLRPYTVPVPEFQLASMVGDLLDTKYKLNLK